MMKNGNSLSARRLAVFKCFWVGIVVTFLMPAGWAVDKVIYGEDNRVDVYASTNTMFMELSRSTAAQIPYTNITYLRQDSKAEIKAENLGDLGMCPEERFAGQVTAARCSGFLVGPDLLVTAGHCARTASDCSANAWVFDYKVDPNHPQVNKVPIDSVYGCKEILSQTMDPDTMDDYALIRLNRRATNRPPLQYRREGKIEEGTPLVVIGHPSGLPTKIADGASVRSSEENAYFVANLDTYGGNSGSAVFDAETGIVEGILVRGDTDYEYAPGRNCRISKVCPKDGCRGEDVTRITNIKKLP